MAWNGLHFALTTNLHPVYYAFEWKRKRERPNKNITSQRSALRSKRLVLRLYILYSCSQHRKRPGGGRIWPARVEQDTRCTGPVIQHPLEDERLGKIKVLQWFFVRLQKIQRDAKPLLTREFSSNHYNLLDYKLKLLIDLKIIQIFYWFSRCWFDRTILIIDFKIHNPQLTWFQFWIQL